MAECDSHPFRHLRDKIELPLVITMDDRGMPDSQIIVHDLEVIHENETLQNNNSYGSSIFASEQFADGNGTLLDSSSSDWFTGIGVDMDRASDLLYGFSIYPEPTKSGIIEHAFFAMEELSKIGIAGQPFWQRQGNTRCEILNDIEYLRQFGQVETTLREIVKLMEVGEPQYLPSFGTYHTEDPLSIVTPTVGPQTEGSRDIAYIKMAPICIVELLMNVVSFFFHPFHCSCIPVTV
ncbi:unnamed protein product [Sphenostylis stenocarpa]|uniref:Uncharacterized protein n=1 Tax=Sphenostylis stenocarpa TaxID=92480 RepID=A0AA86VYU6_9FABA|nr:unnamed protein product [Sphenostylis stenocarpa]